MFDHYSNIFCHVHERNHIMNFEGIKVVGHEANFHEGIFLEAWFFNKGSTLWKGPYRHPRS